MAVDLGSAIPRWQTLAIIGLIGVLLIIFGNVIVPTTGFWKWLPMTLEGIGIALVSAAILAATIENWLLSDLAKDVFLTTVAQHLPVEYRNGLRSELLRLAGYKFYCTRQVLRFRFEPIQGSDHLRLTVILDKNVRNISPKTEKMCNLIWVDDWGLDERSKIIECGAAIDGTKVGELEPPETLENGSVRGQTKLFDVAPEKTVNLTSIAVQVVHRNQDIFYTFQTPILNPIMDATEAQIFERQEQGSSGAATERICHR
jgi:hypothetical protein